MTDPIVFTCSKCSSKGSYWASSETCPTCAEKDTTTMTDYAGIDYGMGQSNVDKSNGIRYGVININRLNEWAIDNFEADYGQASCPKCGGEVADYDDEEHGEYTYNDGCSDYACDECKEVYDSSECYSEEPHGWILDDYVYTMTLDEHSDIFIIKSPYYTYAQYCSPCAPGACHLDSPLDNLPEGHPKVYCLGADWFDGGKAPYTVYRVTDDTVVENT